MAEVYLKQRKQNTFLFLIEQNNTESANIIIIVITLSDCWSEFKLECRISPLSFASAVNLSKGSKRSSKKIVEEISNTFHLS